jgi:hypothetical protein
MRLRAALKRAARVVRRSLAMWLFRLPALASMLIASAASAKDWTDQAHMRDVLFGWCMDSGYEEPSRTDAEMQINSPYCAAESARRADEFRSAGSAALALAGLFCKDSAASRALPAAATNSSSAAGFCLEYPQRHGLSDLSVVGVLRDNVARADYMREIEAWLRRRLSGEPGSSWHARLTAAGMDCSPPETPEVDAWCNLQIGILGWNSQQGAVLTNSMCSVVVRVGPHAKVSGRWKVLVTGVCL